MNVIFFGTPSFSVSSLQALLDMPGVSVRAVVTQPDRPSGRGGLVKASPVKELAMRHSIPVLQPTSLRKELDSFQAQLASCGPLDVGIVIAFGQILPKAVLGIPRAGCVNIHASLLPRWRGAAPIQRAILAGDTETGVCLMQMDEGLDTGGVYSREPVQIGRSDTAQTLHDTLAALGARLLARDLPLIVSGKLSAAPQPAEGVTYAHKIEPAEGCLDWTKGADELDRAIRALSPHPGAFTFWRGSRLKLLLSSVAPGGSVKDAAPGTVAAAYSDTITVACGAGSLAISQLQLAGKRQMSSGEFLRGTPISPGERFSSQAPS
jgi:methionyl-tRNA formyltransferase